MVRRAFGVGLLAVWFAVACNGSDGGSGDGSAGEAGADGAGAHDGGAGDHGGVTSGGTVGNAGTAAAGDTTAGTGATAGNGTGGNAGNGTGGTAGDSTGGTAGNSTGGTAGTSTGGDGTSGQAGAGGSGGVSSKCHLDPEAEGDDSPSSSSNVTCGRLGDLSAATGFVLDVGHAMRIGALRRTATRLLSYDDVGKWVLWDAQAGTMVKRGQSQPYPLPYCEFCDARPLPTAPVLSATHLAALTSPDAKVFSLELRSALDGHVVATLTMPGLSAVSDFGFASDGSYLWATSQTHISAWSTAGALLAEANGTYHHRPISAVPGELRVGSKDTSTIQKISTVTGVSTLSAAFQGTFHSWFLDGDRFLTTISDVVRVYSTDTVTQEKFFTLSSLNNLTGQGDHVWTFNKGSGALDIYSLSDPSTPAASLNPGTAVFPAGNNIAAVHQGSRQISIIKLGPTITQDFEDVPGYDNVTIAVDSAGNWAVGGHQGQVFASNDPTHALSCGWVSSIARADDGTTAVSTAGGGVLLFKLTDDSRQYLSTIPFRTSRLELSRDGLVLAASADPWVFQSNDADLSLHVFSLPDGSELKVWPFGSDAGDRFFGFGMSSEGNRFVHSTGTFDFATGWTYTQTVRDLDDDVSLTLNDVADGGELPPLSSDGTRVAVRSDDAAKIYENGVLTNALPGRPIAWFDDDRLLVELGNAYRIYDSSGQLQATPNLQQRHSYDNPRIVSPTEIYLPEGAIYSVTRGEEVWRCDQAFYSVGSAAAGYAAFVSYTAKHKVMFDSY